MVWQLTLCRICLESRGSLTGIRIHPNLGLWSPPLKPKDSSGEANGRHSQTPITSRCQVFPPIQTVQCSPITVMVGKQALGQFGTKPPQGLMPFDTRNLRFRGRRLGSTEE